MTEQERDAETAMIFLGTWGSTTCPPRPWGQWAWAEADYAPEWLTERDLGCPPDDCTTVLDFGLCFDPEPPPGHRLAYRFGAGERSCPWCGDGTGEEARREVCQLCEGDGLLYWGEECQVCIFAPLISSADFEGIVDGLAELCASPDAPRS